MKVYIVFKQKSPKSKEFMVAGLYTTEEGAFNKQLRIHRKERLETYSISKSVKGQYTADIKKIASLRSGSTVFSCKIKKFA